MKHNKLFPLVTVLFVACGGGESADNGGEQPASGAEPAPAPSSSVPAAPTGEMTMPSWYTIDNAAKTVHLSIVAGATADNNHWNYNGFINGALAINVPTGYTVSIDFSNEDPNMAHSLMISSETSNFAVPPAPNPAFEGAMSANAQSMVEATMPGDSETITFTAGEPGMYSMVCIIPGHSALGMWLYFNVTDDGSAGVQGL
jgi:sulfocyanin